MATVKVTSENFESEVLNSDKPVLVDLWADWCGPCKMLGPVLEQISSERGDIKVCKINVDEEPQLASEFRVSSIPHVALLNGNRIIAQSIGFKPKADILAMVDGAIKGE